MVRVFIQVPGNRVMVGSSQASQPGQAREVELYSPTMLVARVPATASYYIIHMQHGTGVANPFGIDGILHSLTGFLLRPVRCCAFILILPSNREERRGSIVSIVRCDELSTKLSGSRCRSATIQRARAHLHRRCCQLTTITCRRFNPSGRIPTINEL